MLLICGARHENMRYRVQRAPLHIVYIPFHSGLILHLTPLALPTCLFFFLTNVNIQRTVASQHHACTDSNSFPSSLFQRYLYACSTHHTTMLCPIELCYVSSTHHTTPHTTSIFALTHLFFPACCLSHPFPLLRLEGYALFFLPARSFAEHRVKRRRSRTQNPRKR